MPNNAIKVDYRKLDDLKAYPNNPRVHSRTQRRKLQSILRRHGQVAPIIIDPNGVIVDGHAVCEALKDLGYDEVATVMIANRGPEEIRAIRLALNRLPEDAGWGNQRLKTEFEELLECGFELEFTGFDQVEVDMTLSIDMPKSGIVEDAPDLFPPEGPAVTRHNEIWILDDHRILCSDARDETNIRRLFGCVTARMIFTDPPYNVFINGHVSGRGKTRHRSFLMACGEMSEADFAAFLSAFFGIAKIVLEDGAIAFVCIDWRHVDSLLTSAKREGFTLKNLIVWVKTNAGMGAFYRSQHELIPVFKWGSAPHVNTFELGNKGRSRSNVWTYRGMNSFGPDRDELFAAHPTIKPVALVADAIKDVSRRDDIVFDPFLGSGTTLIAAHETGRRCFGVEVDLLYVDLAVRRWQDATGHQAILQASGVTFDDMETIRTSRVPLLPAPQKGGR